MITSFNANKADGKHDPGGACCTGGPLDLNNGGAGLFPGWSVEYGEREWKISLDILYSATEPTGPVFANPTFNFIVWTDQGLTDVTDSYITYTLATPPGLAGDADLDGDVEGDDFLDIQTGFGTTYSAADVVAWKTNYGTHPAVAVQAAVPEPSALAMALLVVGGIAGYRRCA